MGSIKFALFTDLHHDVIPDGLERLKSFITRVREAEVDFIIDLEDFCHPCHKNEELLSIFNDFEEPHYHVIGNKVSLSKQQLMGRRYYFVSMVTTIQIQ